MHERSLDAVDRLLLAALQENGRLSNKELAARVGLAPSTCLERVRRLRREGVLTGFRALVEPRALGVGLQAVVSVRLARHSQAAVEAFAAHAAALAETLRVYHTAGRSDFLLHLAVRDGDHLRRVILDHLSSRAEVGHLETSLIFEHRGRERVPDLLPPDARP